jgi:hypothetical protein
LLIQDGQKKQDQALTLLNRENKQMGSSNGKKLTQVAAGVGGFSIGGPAGAALAVAATRSLQGKELLGSDISPKVPGLPGLPETPKRDFRKEEAIRQATIDRIRRRTKIGAGRKQAIGTSALGITAPLRATERSLRGA